LNSAQVIESTATPVAAEDDVVSRLEKLKMMLDKQPISQEGFDQKKNEIFSQM